MAAPSQGLSRHELVDLRHSLASVDDAKILRIVSILDENPTNVAAEQVLSSLRPRLAKLRPPRRLNFTRLLFSPLDVLIVPPQRWTPGSPTIPRTVLQPLAQTVRASLGAALQPIDAAISGLAVDRTAAQQVGGKLWLAAGRILSNPPPPVDWDASGLRPNLYPLLAHAVGTALTRTLEILLLRQDIDHGIELSAGAVKAILDSVAEEPPETMVMTVALLLAQLPQTRTIVQLHAGVASGARAALQRAEAQATAALIGSLESDGATESQVIGAPLDDAAAEVRRIATLLKGIEVQQPLQPELRARMQGLRSRLDAACRVRFTEALSNDILMPLKAGTAIATQAGQAAIENASRRVRALETEGRKIGGAATYDALLSQAAAAITVTKGEDMLGVARKARLVEILAGPEAAMRLLEPVG